MKTNFSISIDAPCSKQFDQFKKRSNGGFCGSCQKQVIDFRQMSDDQVISFLQQNKVRTCGYFKSSQINRTMETSKSTKFKFLRVAAVAVFSLLSLYAVQAQNNTLKTKTEQNIQKEKAQDNLLTGTITDESGPLAGANVVLKGTRIGVTTDFEGKFKFPRTLKEGDVLIVSYVGYEPQKFVIKKDQKVLNVKLSGDDLLLLGEVEVKQVYSSKRK